MNITNYINLFLISCSVLFAGISLSLLSPFYPKEALSKGVTVTESGIVLGSVFITTIIITPLFGKYIEMLGARWFLIAGTFIVGVGNFLFGFLSQVEDKNTFFLLSIIIRIITAIGESAVAPASYPLAGRQVSKENNGKAMALAESFFGIGTMFGPTMGGLLYDMKGFPMPFWVSGGLMMVVSLISCVLLKDVPSSEEETVINRKVSWCEVIQNPGVLISVFALIFAGTGWSWYSASLGPFMFDTFNLSPSETGLAFMIFGLSYTIFTPAFGFLIDRGLDGLFTVLIGNFLITIGFVFLGPVPPLNFIGDHLWLTVASIGVQGLGSAATFLGSLLYMMKSATDVGLPDSDQTKGMVSSLWTVADCVGGFLGSALGSVAFDTLGFKEGSLIIALAMLFTVFVILGYICTCRSSSSIVNTSDTRNNNLETHGLLEDGRSNSDYGTSDSF